MLKKLKILEIFNFSFYFKLFKGQVRGEEKNEINEQEQSAYCFGFFIT